MWVAVLTLLLQAASDPCSEGRQKALQDFSLGQQALWAAAGALTGPVGVLIAYASTHLPDETDRFARCYAQQIRTLRTNYALTGCSISALILLGCLSSTDGTGCEAGQLSLSGCGSGSSGGCSNGGSSSGCGSGSSGGCSNGGSSSSSGCS